MPKHAFNRSIGARLLSTRGAVVVGTFAALTCAAVTGTAHAASAPPAAPATSGTTPHAGKTTYTVKPGDTLIGIARSQKVAAGWKAIAAANKISSPYIIHPRQVLTLPSATHATATATAAKVSVTTAAATTPAYTDDLDGWIKHSLAIMAQNGIPGSYDGIYRNTMRESSGNPNAINLWDSNAAAGHPSIGLLQVIQPTFTAYHVPGTSTNIYDPVANITAACNYAYHVYGSIDNVNGPY
ncbi:LysM peptidoglycan-binding domain-containing protein [Streptomyces sp. NBC_01476]|uniref:LysM peptidoglycan-binding domain-containing protein n=1 Tax=Streptomyces sp. NBC_01476 TaxID=2903881 RepID=UPI002E30DC1F|nr:LysM peptidoglycan-binding domain-containing protein [Streptomyces sp. NBC_01476]